MGRKTFTGADHQGVQDAIDGNEPPFTLLGAVLVPLEDRLALLLEGPG